MIVPERSSNVKKWMISDQTIKIAVGIVAFAFLFTATASVFAIQYFQHRAEFQQATFQNHYLESELQQIQNQLNVADSTLVRVQKFEQKLRVITQLDTQPTTANVGPISTEDQAYMNQNLGTINPDGTLDSPYQRSGVNMLQLDLNKVTQRASLQEQSLQELYELLKDQRSVLAATPSIKPVDGYYTSGFGYRISPFTGTRQLHSGLDMYAPIGTPVRSTADGVITRVANDPGYGKFLVISHGYGLSTLYAHNSKILVKVGQRIKRGQTIALVGNTGRSTGPHLHYEVKLNGVAINPVKYILN